MTMARLGLAALLLLAAAFARADRADVSTAKQRYESGLRNFDLGRFEEAAEDFQAAYKLTGDPTLLFNTAQAYRQAHNFSKALLFYKTYLGAFARRGREPPNRQEVEERIAEAQQSLGAAASQPVTPAPEPPDTKEPATPSPPPPKPPVVASAPRQPAPPPAGAVVAAPARPVSTLRRVGIALTAIGGAALIVGGAMSGLAAASARKIEQAPRGPFDASLQDLEAAGIRYEQAAIGSFVGGGVVAAVGVVLLGVSFKR